MIQHLIPGNPSVPKKIAFLVSNREFKLDELKRNYFDTLSLDGVHIDDIIVYNLQHNSKGKVTATDARKWLETLEPLLKSQQIEHIAVCDGSYFKALTKVKKVEPEIGYTCKSSMWDWASIFYVPNYRQMYFNPQINIKISLALQAIAGATRGELSIFDRSFSNNIIYLYSTKDIQKGLIQILQHDKVAYDIETFSLQIDKAGLGTISFAVDDHGAIVFPIDLEREKNHSKTVRKMLKEFFIETARRNITLIPHGGTFDAKVLIWELFMKDSEDIPGMLYGLEILHNNVEDTHTLAYLALNSTAGNKLKLKELAFEFTGNYALSDIQDITQYDLKQVLEYNAIDAMATFWVHKRYRPIVRNEQEDVYQKVFRPSEKTITQMELCGLPLNLATVLLVENKLEDICKQAYDTINSSQVIIEFIEAFRELLAKEATSKLKKKIKTADEFLSIEFNPNSNKQMPLLLYKGLALPILKETDGGEGSTSVDALSALIKYEQKNQNRQYVLELLDAFIILAEADKILTSFIPAFKEKGVTKGDWLYLLGSFNLGGTVSGRLSSSNPNMQNLPSTGTKYAKLIKTCFAPPLSGEWLFVGADYFSLEDKISALQTKDPAKLAVYLEGYDGHCLRAYSYFKKQMDDITKELDIFPDRKVEIINSIAKRYPTLRQNSKGLTFALTYTGTWRTLVENFGISVKEAKEIENSYHDLYQVSDEWVKEQMEFAREHGYVELAFGLRLRTPVLPRTLTNSRTEPYEAKKEKKTAGNALGQSYGLLNSYSANMFMERVWNHPKYRYEVLPCAQIHDSQYYLIRNTLGCLKWVNDNLIECMEWCDLDAIKHDKIKLGAELEVYYPNWAYPITVPNKATLNQIKKILTKK
jgi:DNA polymerase-1